MIRAILAVSAVLAAVPATAQTTPLPAPVAEERPPVRPIKPSKIILVGDSTTAVIGGWGPSFCAYHVTSFAACVNLARGGRSSYNYRAEGSWDVALAEMKAPGYVRKWVLIQFGHNDQPGKPGRSTDLATEFPENLRRYVREVREAGAEPVLVTPLVRRQFKDGKHENDLEPWAEAIRKVAAELQVPLIDLNARSAAAVQAMGPTAANRFAQSPPSAAVAAAALTGTTIPGQTGVAAPAAPATVAPAPPGQSNAAVEPMGQAKTSFDYTHLGREGADYFAAMVTRELAVVVPTMRGLLVE